MHQIPRTMLPAALCAAACSLALAAEPKPHSIAGLQLGPTTTVVSEPLNDLGYPDYVAALNRLAAEGVDPEDNFWVAFDETLPVTALGGEFAQKLTTYPGFHNVLTRQPRFLRIEGDLTEQPALQKLYELQGRAGERPWRAAEIPEIARWLEQNEAALEKIADAARRPKAYAPLIAIGPKPMTITVLLPHVQECRTVVRALQARAMLHLGEGRNAAAWQDVLTCLRISRHLEKGDFLIERLVGYAIRAMIQDAASQSIADPTLSAEEVSRRWAEAAPLISETSFARVARAERFAVLDMTLALRANRLDLDDMEVKVLSPAGGSSADVEFAGESLARIGKAIQSVMLTSGDINALLEHCNAFHDRLTESLSMPTFLEREAALKAVMQEFGVEGGSDDVTGSAALAFLLGGADGLDHVSKTLVLRQFSAAFQQVNSADARLIARRNALHAAMAVELHRRTTGEDVTNSTQLGRVTVQMADLAGVALPSELNDPFTDSPLRVRHSIDGMLIYSIGPNRKDDGGRMQGADGTDDIVTRLPRTE